MNLPSVSSAELAVLQLLWDQEKLSARQITEQLYPRQSGSDLATVQKLIQRLEKKKLVGRDRSAYVHGIYPLIDRNQFAGQHLAETAAKLTKGSLKPLLAHLVENDQLSPEEQDDIRKLLNKHLKKNK